MEQLPVISLFGLEITVYALLGIVFYLAFSSLVVFTAGKKITRSAAALYCLLSGVSGLLLGRLIFCLVRMNTLFYDEMGEYLGLAPFFDPSLGSVNVAGVMLGLVLSALLCRLLTGKNAAFFLDHATLPALSLFALMRFIEPLSGQGYGIPLEDSIFAFFPMANYNDWNEAWMLNVSFIEGVLAILVILALILLKKKIRKPGTLSLFAVTLFAATQIIPESLRCDDVLYIFIFARVTHIALAATLFIALLLPLLQGKKAGLGKKAFFGELGLMLLGIILCIGAIFALDKTNLPKLLVYAMLFLTLVGLTILNFRRIHKEDIR